MGWMEAQYEMILGNTRLYQVVGTGCMLRHRSFGAPL
jgi:hypothetical protein